MFSQLRFKLSLSDAVIFIEKWRISVIRSFFYDPSYYAHLLVWMVVGSFNTFAVIPLILISNVLWFRNEKYLEVLLGLFFITLLSDSRNSSLAFAQSVKPIQIVFIFILFYLNIQVRGIRANVHTNLVLYISVAVLCLFSSSLLLQSFQKTVSYFLILLIIPNLLFWSYELRGVKVFRDMILFFCFMLLIGIAARLLPVPYVNPFLEGRFTGLFGNPNGLAIFCLILFMMVNLVLEFFPNLFSSKERNLLYLLITVSLITSGSRGGLLAVLGFLGFRYYAYRFGFIAFVAAALLAVSFEFATELLASFSVALGLENFLRVETLESGSGRVVAIDFAWENIQKNFWIGRGIGFGDELFKINYHQLALLGHQGGVHNTFLNIWLDTGLIGLLAFLFGWFRIFSIALKKSKYVWGVLIGIFISVNAEAWLAASLSPWTISFLCLVTMLMYMAPDQHEKEPPSIEDDSISDPIDEVVAKLKV